MKKLFLVASMMMFSAGVFAQHLVGSLTIQPKAGLNIATISGPDDSDPRIGLAVGAEFEYQFTKLFSLSAGAIYSMQGAKQSGTFDGIRAKGTYKIDYINIPILANIYVTNGFALKFGLQPGFNVNSGLSASSQGVDVGVDLSALGIDIKSFDFAIPVGLSYEYNNFVIDARYNIGAMKMTDIDDSKHNVFQFTLGYKFSL